MMTSRSRRPYLIRAIYEWAVDNAFTPHVLVAADEPGVDVPRQYVQDGRITLNISPMAVQSLDLRGDPIWFSARFAGRAHDVFIPARAVLAVFARENGEGVVFGEPEPPTDSPADPVGAGGSEPPKPTKSNVSHLRRVK